MKHEHEEAARLVHQRIVQLLRQTNQVLCIFFWGHWKILRVVRFKMFGWFQERTSMEDITKGHIHSENSQPSGSAIDIDDLLIGGFPPILS